MKKVSAIVVVVWLMILAATSAKAQETATVKVKCNDGEKINNGLKHLKSDNERVIPCVVALHSRLALLSLANRSRVMP